MAVGRRCEKAVDRSDQICLMMHAATSKWLLPHLNTSCMQGLMAVGRCEEAVDRLEQALRLSSGPAAAEVGAALR